MSFQSQFALTLLLTCVRASIVKMEGFLKLEQIRCEELERQLAASSVQLKDELRSLSDRMDSDLAKERVLRHQLERDHRFVPQLFVPVPFPFWFFIFVSNPRNRKEIATTEEIARMEKSRMEEEMRAERLSYLKREAELLEEKVYRIHSKTLLSLILLFSFKFLLLTLFNSVIWRPRYNLLRPRGHLSNSNSPTNYYPSAPCVRARWNELPSWRVS